MFKKLFCFLAFLIYFNLVFGQWNYTYNFEDTNYYGFLEFEAIDSLHDNTWQIGKPQKTVFTSANSFPNVIVTDTLAPYPINDSSIFIITQNDFSHTRCTPIFYFSGYYWVNSDTLTDYGKIEVSPDLGTTWLELLKVSGNSNGWVYFSIELYNLLSSFGNYVDYDTVLYRFSFVSDDIHSGKDGLMFDDLNFYYESGVSVYEIDPEKGFKIYPNPSKNKLNIHLIENLDLQEISILDVSGKQVVKLENKLKEIDISNLENGVYMLNLKSAQGIFQERFIISD